MAYSTFKELIYNDLVVIPVGWVSSGDSSSSVNSTESPQALSQYSYASPNESSEILEVNNSEERDGSGSYEDMVSEENPIMPVRYELVD